MSAIKMSITPRGVAAFWLRDKVPSAGEAEVASLAKLIESIYDSGVSTTLDILLEDVKESPTVSAAVAKLEARGAELEREEKKRMLADRDDGVDFLL